MAVDLVSPRISFSHDLKESDSIPIEFHRHQRSDALLLESSTIDFEFGIGRSFQSELSPADELFANGKILPIEVKKINSLPIQQRPTRENLESKPISPSLRKNPIIRPPPSTAAGISRTEKQSLKELLSINSDDLEDEEEEEKKQNSKPFWQFRKSSSLNFDRTNSLIRSLHFLSRSNSTGSAPNPNPKPSKIIIQKDPNSNPKPSSSSIKRTNSSSSSSHNNNYYYLYKSPSLKKNYSNGGHGGVRISPVLHIPHACISRNSVLFGFSSLFCNGKSKKKKKSC